MFSYKNKLDRDLKLCIDKSYYNSYRVIIKCKSFFKDIERKIPSLKGNIIRSISSINLICANVTSHTITRLLEYPEVEYICFDDYATLCGGLSVTTANGVNISSQTSFSGKGITIGLLDSGIYPHPDLLSPYNKIKKFVDFINDLTYPYDDNGHGTAMAGVLCGSGSTSKFLYKGVAEKADIYCCKVFNAIGKAYISDVLFAIQSILYDEENKIKILCLPFELTNKNITNLEYFESMLQLVIANNIIPVVPSGSNINGENTIQGIALSPYCITVGGLDTTKSPFKPYIYSSGGNKSLKKPEVSAACVNISCLNTIKDYISERDGVKLYPPQLKTPYINFNGTSVACAYICGVIALLLEHNPELTLNDVKSLIKISCTNDYELSHNLIGEGTIDLSKLLK